MARSGTKRVGRPRRSPRRGRRALHLVVSLAVTLSTLLVAIIAIGQATGAWRLAPVLSGSMEPNVPKGAMVVAEQVDIHHLRVGDIMLFNAPLDGHPPVVHRIHEIFEIGGEPAFRTKGDANDAPDAWTIHLHARKVWRVAHVIPYAGTLVGLLHQADLRVLVLVIGIGTMTLTGLFAIWHDTGSRRADEGADEGDGASPGATDHVRRRRAPRRRLAPHAGHLATFVAIILVVGLAGVAHALFTSVPTNPAPGYATGALTAPSSLHCNWTSATALTLAWTDTSPTFTTGYTVNRGNASGGPYSTNVGSTTGETSTSLADNAPAPPTLRYYVAVAKHGNWSSANSTQVASNACIASINLVAGTTAGFSGDGAAATAAKLSAPGAVAVDSSGNVYIADTDQQPDPQGDREHRDHLDDRRRRDGQHGVHLRRCRDFRHAERAARCRRRQQRQRLHRRHRQQLHPQDHRHDDRAVRRWRGHDRVHPVRYSDVGEPQRATRSRGEHERQRLHRRHREQLHPQGRGHGAQPGCRRRDRQRGVHLHGNGVLRHAERARRRRRSTAAATSTSPTRPTTACARSWARP